MSPPEAASSRQSSRSDEKPEKNHNLSNAADPAKKKALEAALDQIDKVYG
nr:hypothetical protein [Planctomycetota bacterium]